MNIFCDIFIDKSAIFENKSFAENIAFGINKKDIDFQRVIYAAKYSEIDKFIEKTKCLWFLHFINFNGWITVGILNALLIWRPIKILLLAGKTQIA